MTAPLCPVCGRHGTHRLPNASAALYCQRHAVAVHDAMQRFVDRLVAEYGDDDTPEGDA